MKRLVTVLAVLSVFAALPPAHAAKKPVKTTMYLHGYSQFGELDGADHFANAAPVMSMDGKKPEAGTPKSMRNGTPGLNTQCTGFPLAFPTWQGSFSGTIVGDATLSVRVVSPATIVTARLWTDAPVFSCNEAYITPASEVFVDVPAGDNTVEIVFPKLKLKGAGNIMIQLLGSGTGSNGRVLYDSADMALSSLSFNCIPAQGSSCL